MNTTIFHPFIKSIYHMLIAQTHRSVFAALVIALAPIPESFAAVINEVRVFDPNVIGRQQIETGPSLVQVVAEFGQDGVGTAVGYVATNIAKASPGRVGVSSATEGRGSGSVGSASAKTSGTFTILGPGSTVSGSLNLGIEGSVGVDVSAGPGAPSAAASMAVSFAIGGGGSGNAYVSLSDSPNQEPTLRYLQSINVFDGTQLPGQQSAWNFNYTTPTYQLAVGTPIAFELTAQATAGVGSGINPELLSRAGSLFGNTISLSTGGPVFNLPDGYTVVSEDFGIVNNFFTPVPLPASAWMLLTGVIVLFGKSTCHKKTDKA